jgi:hypothetical protein
MMTRREFTARLSARIVWMGLALEAVYFFYLAATLAAAARNTPGWSPDMAAPGIVVFTAFIGIVMLLGAVLYFLPLFKIRGWFHLLSPVFLLYGLFALSMAGYLTQKIYGEWKGGSVTLNALSGFVFMLLGIFVVTARLFMPKTEAQAIGALPPHAPADRPEP